MVICKKIPRACKVLGYTFLYGKKYTKTLYPNYVRKHLTRPHASDWNIFTSHCKCKHVRVLDTLSQRAIWKKKLMKDLFDKY